ncbi:hypothetical protein BGZ63DRAFT_423352 [Mariannaea sp. PMI_226]|nr:hypothetical protein BGZ63DRAFT_423352 [Mariannaea sp. PMI_226]
MSNLRRLIITVGDSALAEPTVTQPPNAFSTMDGFNENILLNAEVSRVISASQSTTLFTSIVPRQSAEEAGSSTSGSPDSSSQSNYDPGTPNYKNLITIGIVFVILLALAIIIVSVFFVRRHRLAAQRRKRDRKQGTTEQKVINYSGWQHVDLSAPTAAHLPNTGTGYPTPGGVGGTQNGYRTDPPAYYPGPNVHSATATRWR